MDSDARARLLGYAFIGKSPRSEQQISADRAATESAANQSIDEIPGEKLYGRRKTAFAD
jgi:hypothetical protein